MHRHTVKEVYDDYILDIYDYKQYYKDNFVYKVIAKSGNVYCYNKSGQFHRLDGPAIEYANGTKVYYIEDKLYSYEVWCEKVKDCPM